MGQGTFKGLFQRARICCVRIDFSVNFPTILPFSERLFAIRARGHFGQRPSDSTDWPDKM
jgi:hypothetical protein